MKHKTLRMKRHFINGKIIIGIDPSKEKHQAMVINSIGDTIKSSFTFKHTYHGFNVTLIKRLKERLQPFNQQNLVFAVETSINYWQKLCYHLNSKGFTVVLVRPLATRHERLPFHLIRIPKSEIRNYGNRRNLRHPRNYQSQSLRTVFRCRQNPACRRYRRH